MREDVEIGSQAFVPEVGPEFGAVREISRRGLVVYVEKAGDFFVSLDAVEAVYSQKVIFNRGKLDRRLQKAIRHAHDAEDPNA
ncbi:MAG TPA: hypothetical protein VH985_25015 [Candidatus Binatia bacterium]|jgi:hypothetical protein